MYIPKREWGAMGLPAWGIRASQGTFSSFCMLLLYGHDILFWHSPSGLFVYICLVCGVWGWMGVWVYVCVGGGGLGKWVGRCIGGWLCW